MKCPVCNQELNDNKVCPQCGYDLENHQNIQELKTAFQKQSAKEKALKKQNTALKKELQSYKSFKTENEKLKEEIKHLQENQNIDVLIEENRKHKEMINKLIREKKALEKELVELRKNMNQPKGLNIGNNTTLQFGNYKQGDNGEVKPIDWLVLEKQNNQALLISKNILDTKKYHNKNEAITWAECDLNKWLNNEFYNEAFSNQEKELVILKDIETSNNTLFRVEGGKACKNHVFLLSIEEAEKYFTDDQKRMSAGSEYVRNVDDESLLTDEDNGMAPWWLRSPGYRSNAAAEVDIDGGVVNAGTFVDDPGEGVRPAIWVSIL